MHGPGSGAPNGSKWRRLGDVERPCGYGMLWHGWIAASRELCYICYMFENQYWNAEIIKILMTMEDWHCRVKKTWIDRDKKHLVILLQVLLVMHLCMFHLPFGNTKTVQCIWPSFLVAWNLTSNLPVVEVPPERKSKVALQRDRMHFTKPG